MERGRQVRNWTYVGEIVEGTLLAAEKINDGTAPNLGTMGHTRVVDAVREVLRYAGNQAKIELHPDKLTGLHNHMTDNSLAKKLLGWEPKVSFMDGPHPTIDWHFATKVRQEVRVLLDRILTER